MGLIFKRVSANRRLLQDPPLFGLVGYADSNFAGDPKDRKSVIGYYFFLNGVIVSWSSKK